MYRYHRTTDGWEFRYYTRGFSECPYADGPPEPVRAALEAAGVLKAWPRNHYHSVVNGVCRACGAKGTRKVYQAAVLRPATPDDPIAGLFARPADDRRMFGVASFTAPLLREVREWTFEQFQVHKAAISEVQ
jgi:hypothetical protein